MYTSKKIGREERLFLQEAKKRNMSIQLINLFKKFNEEEFEQQIKACNVIYNNTAEEFVLEPLKTIEELGKKVIDNSKLYYYTEDKWMFYIKCKEHKIPTPETILLTNNLSMVRAELKEFGRWPVIIKRIYGTCGQYVERADNLKEALVIVKRFWAKDCDKIPFIAQEFIKSYSYRVTIINNKIVQTAIKKSNRWKCTGLNSRSCDKFKVSKDLKQIINKTMQVVKINICGIDLLKKGDKWVVLEVNSDPGLDFIQSEEKKMIGKVLDFIKLYYYAHVTKKKRK